MDFMYISHSDAIKVWWYI